MIEVFGTGAMNAQLNVCTFFEQVVFKPKQQAGDKNSPCLKVPNLPRLGH
jgi:hypothetical protein